MTAARTGRTEQVLVVVLLDPVHGVRVVGALEDGTLFERDPVVGWRSVNGAGDVELSFDLFVTMVGAAERGGARLVGGPYEFGLDVGVTGSVRAGDFRDAGRLLDIGYDMVARVTGP